MELCRRFASPAKRAKERIRSQRGARFVPGTAKSELVRKIAAAMFCACVFFAVLPVFAAVAPPIRSNSPKAVTSSASETVSVSDRVAALEEKVAAAQSAGDNAWMLVSSGLVLLMTGPGLALFYGGIVRKKNVLGTMMQSFALMALISVIWAVFGYSLCFAPGNPFLGGMDYAFLRNVGGSPNPAYAATIPQQTFM